jgi:hypothetical protein
LLLTAFSLESTIAEGAATDGKWVLKRFAE